MKYRKKPVVVDATQWFKNDDHEAVLMPVWSHQGGNKCRFCGKPLDNIHGYVQTLEGGHIVCPGDWIITGVQGEYYPCKPDIFEQTYELAEADS